MVLGAPHAAEEVLMTEASLDARPVSAIDAEARGRTSARLLALQVAAEVDPGGVDRSADMLELSGVKLNAFFAYDLM